MKFSFFYLIVLLLSAAHIVAAEVDPSVNFSDVEESESQSRGEQAPAESGEKASGEESANAAESADEGTADQEKDAPAGKEESTSGEEYGKAEEEAAPMAIPPVGETETVEDVTIDYIPYTDASEKNFYDKFIKDRLEIGTRVLAFSLTDTSDESFLGSINGLDEEQDYAPIYFFVNYNILPYWGVGVSYDQLEVKTLDNGGGDGNFELDGPILYTYLRYLNDSIFTPYGELGLAFYNMGFDPLPEWSEGGVRQFVVDDDIGFVIAAGLDIQVYKNWSLDLYLRYVDAQASTEFYFQDPNRLGSPQETADFPMSHYAYGLGVKYSF